MSGSRLNSSGQSAAEVEERRLGRSPLGLFRLGPRLVSLGLGLLLALLVMSACSENADPDPLVTCRLLLDEARDAAGWDAAIKACEAVGTDDGNSRAAQAHMGRAGVSLLDLLDGLSSSDLEGQALMLDLFTVELGSVEYGHVELAIDLMSALSCNDADLSCSDTDYFNLTIASAVMLNTLFIDHMGLFVCNAEAIEAVKCTAAEEGDIIVPGVTDTGVETLTIPTTVDPQADPDNPLGDFDSVVTIFTNIYTTSGSYYKTKPLAWQDTTANVDLSRISKFSAASRLGSAGLGLADDPDLSDLAALDFSTRIDNGECGYADTVDQAAPGTATSDPATVATNFPRRLNTSTVGFMVDEMMYTMLSVDETDPANPTITQDNTKEWGGSFALPSALLNPDFFNVDCGIDPADANLAEFSACMAAGLAAAGLAAAGTILDDDDNTNNTQYLLPPPAYFIDKTVTRFAGAPTTALCGGADCDHWPLLLITGGRTVSGVFFNVDNDNFLTDDSATATTVDGVDSTNGADATAELSQVLDTAFPIDNTVTAPTGAYPAYACAEGDGLVHYREYDTYLRTFGE